MPKIVINGLPIEVGSRGSQSNGSCMKEISMPSELNKITKNNQNTLLFLHSHQCPHCRQTLPLIEQKCNEAKANNLPVEFVSCPIDVPFCSNLLRKTKSEGVPTTIMLNKNGKDEWKVIGADLKSIDSKIKKTFGSRGSNESMNIKKKNGKNNRARNDNNDIGDDMYDSEPEPRMQEQRQQVKFGVPHSTNDVISSILDVPTFQIQNPNEYNLCLPSQDKKCNFTESLAKYLSF